MKIKFPKSLLEYDPDYCWHVKRAINSANENIDDVIWNNNDNSFFHYLSAFVDNSVWMPIANVIKHPINTVIHDFLLGRLR